MKLLRCLAATFFLATSCLAQLPDYYQSVNRVTWLVQNIDVVKPAWTALGLTDIKEYQNVKMTGTDHGKPVTIYTWQLTGHIGNLTVDMIQPAEGQLNSYNDFLESHKDGIFSVVHEVPSIDAMNREIKRMASLGIGVLQQVTIEKDGIPITYTYFDTARDGKYVLGLVYWPGHAPVSHAPQTVTHLAPVIRESAPVIAYWEKIGFPKFEMEHATPRDDSRYRGQPLSLYFDVGFQRFGAFSYEWIVAPPSPPNIYNDYVKLHGEGIQHIGIQVPDLQQAIASYEKLGYHVWQAGAWGDVGKKNSGQYAYMDTDSVGGVAVELIHAY